MKRIAILMCLALIGSLMHAAVGSVAPVPVTFHHTAPVVAPAQALNDAVSVHAGTAHHQHHSSNQHEDPPASGTPLSKTLSDHSGSTPCPSAASDCCQGAMMLPAQFDIPNPAPVGIAVVVAMRLPPGWDWHGIYKPPRA